MEKEKINILFTGKMVGIWFTQTLIMMLTIVLYYELVAPNNALSTSHHYLLIGGLWINVIISMLFTLVYLLIIVKQNEEWNFADEVAKAFAFIYPKMSNVIGVFYLIGFLFVTLYLSIILTLGIINIHHHTITITITSIIYLFYLIIMYWNSFKMIRTIIIGLRPHKEKPERGKVND